MLNANSGWIGVCVWGGGGGTPQLPSLLFRRISPARGLKIRPHQMAPAALGKHSRIIVNTHIHTTHNKYGEREIVSVRVRVTVTLCWMGERCDWRDERRSRMMALCLCRRHSHAQCAPIDVSFDTRSHPQSQSLRAVREGIPSHCDAACA